MRTALALAFLLPACQSAPETSPPPAPSGGPGETDSETIPAVYHGTYDTDEEACARTTTMTKLAVSADTLDFYYGYATVDAVQPVGRGGHRVDATLYQTEGAVEVVPEPTTYHVEPTGDGLRFESDYGGGSTLIRCPD